MAGSGMRRAKKAPSESSVAREQTAEGAAAPKPTDKTSDERLVELVTSNGLVSRAQVDACLRELDEARARSEHASLADLLVKHEALTEHQARQFADAVAKEASGELIGGYRVIDQLGEGGMGKVYMALQTTLDRVVALKVLSERQANDPAYIERFLREARVAARLENINIVRAIDAGDSRGRYYFAMEWVEGKSLEGLIREHGKIPEGQAIDIALQAARGLECAWQNGLVHRDIKPDNLLITYQGIVKIADLGLAKEIHGQDEARLTQDSVAMGTPHYISPEQAKAEEVDVRSDIYSLGITLYQAVTGELPFKGSDPLSIIVARLRTTPKPPREVNPAVSAGFSQVIETMMALEPAGRHPDPTVLIHDLELVAQGHKPAYAGGTATQRRQAVSDARSRNTVSTLLSSKAIERLRKRSRALVVTGLLLVLAGSLAVGLRYSSWWPAPLAEEHRVEEMALREKAVEENAGSLYEAASAAFEQKRYDDVVAMISAKEADFGETTYGPMLRALAMEARDALSEKIETVERHDRLIASALAEAAGGGHATALALLDRAGRIRTTDKLEEIRRRIGREKLVRDAMGAEIRGDLAGALATYDGALEIAGDSELAAHVLALRARHDRAQALAAARAARDRGEWAAAAAAYASALREGPASERAAVELELGAVEKEAAFATALAEARTAAAAGSWDAASVAAERAAGLKPDASEARSILARAVESRGLPAALTDSIGIKLVLVPSETFTMGHVRGVRAERAEHEVAVDAFYLGAFEVTNAQFEAFDPSRSTARTQFSAADDMPVVNVTWRDACYFCRWLSAKEGATYRLPTEAEWERAARLGGGEYPWGDEPVNEGDTWRCNVAPARQQKYWAADGHLYAAKAGSFASGANRLGIHDLAGNVLEWCVDWYAAEYYDLGVRENPRGPNAGTERVVRGGSFAQLPTLALAYRRQAREPAAAENDLGFRVVREMPRATAK